MGGALEIWLRINSGQLLMELMQDHNMCMLNGRGNDNSNNFTCISGRGKSVVDYHITRIDNMNNLKSFEIVTMNDFCEISNSDILTRKPDHSLFFKTGHCSFTVLEIGVCL